MKRKSNEQPQDAPATLATMKRVRVSNIKDPLHETWLDYLDETEIHAYRLAGYIVAEVSR